METEQSIVSSETNQMVMFIFLLNIIFLRGSMCLVIEVFLSSIASHLEDPILLHAQVKRKQERALNQNLQGVNHMVVDQYIV